MSSTSEQPCERQLAAEIEALKGALADKHSQLLAMESACLQESDRQVELEDSIIAWQDKYERLYESHKRVQKLNQNLEDKLLKLVDRNSGERAQLTGDVATLSVRLAQANYSIQSLKREIERYKTDISVAIQLLQCKPDSFVSPKLSSLPIEIQSKVATYMRLETNSHSDSEGSTSGVGVATANAYHVLPASDSPPPLCPFPPTAMVYSMRGLDGSQQQQQQQQDNGPIKQSQHQHSLPQSQQEAALVVPLGGSAAPAPAAASDSLLVEGRSAGAPPAPTTATSGGSGAQNVVSPSVMAKFLEDELKSSDGELLGQTPSTIKHCDTCVCTRTAATGATAVAVAADHGDLLADLLGSDQKCYSVATQTLVRGGGSGSGDTANSLCLRCNSNLNSPSHNRSPPYLLELLKSSDSVISETKSSVSDYLPTPDKVSPASDPSKPTTDGAAQTPDGTAATDLIAAGGSDAPVARLQPAAKKDDLTVNPMLGHHHHHHHRLSIDRATAEPTPAYLGKTPPAAGSFPSVRPVVKKLPPATGATSVKLTPQQTTTSTAQSTATGGSKFSHDSPSYIIKDTDQMSGSHTTPKSGHGAVGGPLGGGPGGKFGGTSASGGSVGSGLYHAVGSTNSLWSRTSSRPDPEKDGAKMFEIFNRNLIKTIKAENPKMSGPRICALRIQNGSSNILLDSLLDDSADGCDSKPTTPVMYTRRAKFLDEELLLDDDPSIGLNGAIKTTNLPTATATSSDSIGASADKPPGTPANDVPPVGPSDGEKLGRTEDQFVVGIAADGPPVGQQQQQQQGCSNMSTTTTSPHSSDRLCTIGEEVSNLLINTKLTAATRSSVPANKPRPDISVNKLDGIELTSKKSCTHSSSISSEIDLQESAILRRQQLSRVAEWVQNNSKLGHPPGVETLGSAESDSEPLLPHALTDSLNNNNPVKPSTAGRADGKPGTVLANRHFLQSFSRTTASVASNLLNNNGGPPPATKTQPGARRLSNTLLDLNSNSAGLGAIRKVGGGPYGGSARLRPGDSSVTECLLPKGDRDPGVLDGDTTAHGLYSGGEDDEDDDDDGAAGVDLAQMEYNVKQFLLKQNEWSTVRRPSTGAPTKGLFPGTAVPQTVTAQQQHPYPPYPINPHRTETNL